MDILLDENYNPIIENGDFMIGNDMQQRVELNLISNKGDWREFPTIGAGIRSHSHGSDPKKILREIKVALRQDNISPDVVKWTNEGLEINLPE